MKKKLAILPLLIVMLTGCVTNPSSSNQNGSSDTSLNEPSSSEISSTSSSTEPSSSENSSSSGESSSSEPVQYKTNISEMRSIGLSYAGNVNAQKVYTSTVKAKFNAQLLTIHDAWTTQGGYTSRYKALVANETGYIFVALTGGDNGGYNYVKDYLDKQQVYTFEGYIGIYCGEPEIVMDAGTKPIYLSGVTLNYDLSATPVDSISDAYTTIKSLPVNSKGTGASSTPIKMTLKYISKVENSVALFTDGSNTIQAHGHDKINNSLSLDNVYEVTAIRIIYHFKAELKFIFSKPSSKTIDFDRNSIATTITAAQIYNNNYDESHPQYASNYAYAEMFTKLYYFEGYANYYTKDNADNIVFDDAAKDRYNAYTNAVSGKALFANNNSCLTLYTESDYYNCPFTEYAFVSKAQKVKIGFYFVAYLLNTNDYWQIQVFEDTIFPIS